MNIKLTLGPLQYYWPRDITLQFYADAANWPLDVIYLGETVCSRRHELRLEDWLYIAQQLRDNGKEVVLSTLALIESESDLKTLRKITGNNTFTVEANEFGAVHLLSQKDIPFIAGPFLNIYNPDTLQFLSQRGATRWVPPVEMSRDTLAAMALPPNMFTEIFTYGRLPLAFSARCFTARHYNLQKDDCRFCCLEHPNGLLLNTRDNEPFLVMNGIQTQSAKIYNLIAHINELAAVGISHLRLSPQANNMHTIIQAFRSAIQSEAVTHDAMQALMPDTGCDGYWLGKAGMQASA